MFTVFDFINGAIAVSYLSLKKQLFTIENLLQSCPKVVHDLMLSCWHKDRVKRPKFKDIRGTIDKWIRSPELLKHEESVVTRRYVAIYFLLIYNKIIKLEYEVKAIILVKAIHSRLARYSNCCL